MVTGHQSSMVVLAFGHHRKLMKCAILHALRPMNIEVATWQTFVISCHCQFQCHCKPIKSVILHLAPYFFSQCSTLGIGSLLQSAVTCNPAFTEQYIVICLSPVNLLVQGLSSSATDCKTFHLSPTCHLYASVTCCLPVSPGCHLLVTFLSPACHLPVSHLLVTCLQPVSLSSLLTRPTYTSSR